MKTDPAPPPTRGRPRTVGDLVCDRCGRGCTKLAARWPDGALCGICYDTATRTHGTCPGCTIDRMLPGRDDAGRSICVDCAGIAARFDCVICGEERPRFRKGTCVRCSVRADLTKLLTPTEPPTAAAAALLDALAAADRPESIYTWMRHPGVLDLLTHFGDGTLSPSHTAFDALPPGRHVEHLRAILVDLGRIPPRDEALARFENWLQQKLEPVTDPAILKPLERFAHWHHLRSIRRRSSPESSSQAATRNAKQEITVALDFLTWLSDTTERTLLDCDQGDIDTWLATGPSTRTVVRNFVIFAIAERLSSRNLTVPHRAARSTRRLSEDERLAGIRDCLLSTSVPVATRTAMMLLLLYAQPLVRVCALRTDAITDTGDEMTITFDTQPVLIPTLFAETLRVHLADRSRSRTTTVTSSPWLFPGGRAGQHITHDYLLTQIRELGLNPLATRNRALDDLVTAMPAPVVADLFNYSYQVTTKHAAESGEPFSRYVRGEN